MKAHLALLLITMAATLAWLLAPWAVRVCRAKGLLAGADDRHIHKTPTPHGGGFILPLVITPLGLAAVWLLQLPFAPFLSVLLIASLLVAWVGWLDDHHHLQPRLRLAVHLLAVGIGLMFLPQLFDEFPLWVEKILLLLGWGWFVNLYNFMDGADGLATPEAIFISLALALIVPPFAPLALLIAAAATAFLRVNAPPAKVFMGDVCSTWLGYVLGGLLLVACADDTWTVIWPLATITLVFSADATLTLLRRIAQGHAPWQPHRTFWFHRFLALGSSHRRLITMVAILNLALLAIAKTSLLFASSTASAIGFAGGILLIILALSVITHLEKQHKQHKGSHHAKSKA